MSSLAGPSTPAAQQQHVAGMHDVVQDFITRIVLHPVMRTSPEVGSLWVIHMLSVEAVI